MKMAQCVAFNEAFVVEDPKKIPPSVKILQAHDVGALDPSEFAIPKQLLNLDVSMSPFTRFKDLVLPLNWYDEKALGLEFASCLCKWYGKLPTWS
jgi:hypothetical protein